jgi:hypothetical protein
MKHIPCMGRAVPDPGQGCWKEGPLSAKRGKHSRNESTQGSMDQLGNVANTYQIL